MKSKRVYLVVVGLLLVLLVAAYGVAARGERNADAAGAPVASYDSLLEALREAGLPASAGAEAEPALFSVEGKVILVGEQMVSVYELADEAAAVEAAGTVNPTGTIIGPVIVDWVEPPHFYRQGNLIVLYAGQHEALLFALGELLGEPFVVGHGMFGPLGE